VVAPSAPIGRDQGRAHPRRSAWSARLESPLAAYYLVLGSVTALVAIGLVMVLSSSNIEALRESNNSYAVFSKQAVFAAIEQQWGKLDILVHSIAWAPKDDLQGGLLNCSAEGFAKSIDVSCHSFIRMARLAVPLMKDGGTMFAMSYYGANRVVPNYNVMGPVKAALEASCRYLAYELGPKGIRVHAMSPGPLKTRAASGLKDFDLLLTEAAQKAPLGELVDIMDVGFACAYLATPYARRISGETVYVDGGVHIMA